MCKEYVVLISLFTCLLVYPDANRFKMYENNADTIDMEILADTIIDSDSPMYKKGYEDGIDFAEKQWKELGIWGKLRVKGGMKTYDFPEYIDSRGENYEQGFISGHNDKAFMPPGMIFLFYYLAAPLLSLLIIGIIYGISSLFSLLI